MSLDSLTPAKGSIKAKYRVGRGPGSGNGKNAGRGPQRGEVPFGLLPQTGLRGRANAPHPPPSQARLRQHLLSGSGDGERLRSRPLPRGHGGEAGAPGPAPGAREEAPNGEDSRKRRAQEEARGRGPCVQRRRQGEDRGGRRQSRGAQRVIESLKNIFRVPDLRNRLLFTLGMLAVYRLGEHTPPPRGG